MEGRGVSLAVCESVKPSAVGEMKGRLRTPRLQLHLPARTEAPPPHPPSLPPTQIVQFILERTGEAGGADVSSMDVTGGGVDPFTGGRGGGRSAAPHYVRPPPAPPIEFSVTGGGVDPFTGGSQDQERGLVCCRCCTQISSPLSLPHPPSLRCCLPCASCCLLHRWRTGTRCTAHWWLWAQSATRTQSYAA